MLAACVMKGRGAGHTSRTCLTSPVRVPLMVPCSSSCLCYRPRHEGIQSPTHTSPSESIAAASDVFYIKSVAHWAPVVDENCDKTRSIQVRHKTETFMRGDSDKQGGQGGRKGSHRIADTRLEVADAGERWTIVVVMTSLWWVESGVGSSRGVRARVV